MFTFSDNRNEPPHGSLSHDPLRVAASDLVDRPSHNINLKVDSANAEKAEDKSAVGTACCSEERRVQHNYHDHMNDLPPPHLYDEEMLGHGRCFTGSTSGLGGAGLSFTIKLHEMLNTVEKEELKHIVSWQPHGRCFVIRDVEAFKGILPRFFGIDKLPSFQRQLNMYGFQRITQGRDKSGYYHELFLRGRIFLAYQIRRIRIKGKGARAKANPEQEPDFWSMPWLEGFAPCLDQSNQQSVSLNSGHFLIGMAPQASSSGPKESVISSAQQVMHQQSDDLRMDSLSIGGTFFGINQQNTKDEAVQRHEEIHWARVHHQLAQNSSDTLDEVHWQRVLTSSSKNPLPAVPQSPAPRDRFRDMRQQPSSYFHQRMQAPSHTSLPSSSILDRLTEQEDRVDCWGKRYFPVDLLEEPLDDPAPKAVDCPPPLSPLDQQTSRVVESPRYFTPPYLDMRQPWTDKERAASCPPRLGQKVFLAKGNLSIDRLPSMPRLPELRRRTVSEPICRTKAEHANTISDINDVQGEVIVDLFDNEDLLREAGVDLFEDADTPLVAIAGLVGVEEIKSDRKTLRNDSNHVKNTRASKHLRYNKR